MIAETPEGTIVTREQLVSFYAVHDPSKIGMVDKILAHYPVTQLLSELTKKYGCAPDVTLQPTSPTKRSSGSSRLSSMLRGWGSDSRRTDDA